MSFDAARQALGMDKQTVSIEIGGQTMTIETGYIAKQAAGSVVVRYGDTMVMSTACDGEPRAGIDFFPLMVDYREKTYAAGRIPGNFFRREARPSEHETLTARLTDRPLRPLFPKGYKRDTNVTSWVISYDMVNAADVLSMNGASAALTLSYIPFQGPIGAVRIGLIEDELVVNPTHNQRGASQLDLVVAGTAEAITMVEAGAQEITEDRMVEALMLAHSEIKKICAAISELRERVGKPKAAHTEPAVNPFVATIVEQYRDTISTALFTPTKHERYAAIAACRDQVVAALGEGDDEKSAQVKAAFGDAKDEVFRDLILQEKRVDGRDTKTVRPVVVDLDVLPRAHGSVLFTRGETQALVSATLGTGEDEQMIDALHAKTWERFLLHYNFPGFSVGETSGRPGPGRREIGHGALAKRAIRPVLPDPAVWPYTMRVVADITESNGSSSMASTCGTSLALMAAGVPVTAPVAGIAMGLVKEGDRYAILTDILGDEDHYGDMDFKVCGTQTGITALQMDIKIAGLSAELLGEALAQARDGRLHLLEIMNQALAEAREKISPFAPQIEQVQIDPALIAKIIGKGGETIRRIQDESGASVNIDDDGVITLASPDLQSIEEAKRWVRDLTEMPEEGRVYKGTVTSVADFGAFVEILPGTEGLVHISEWDHRRTANMDNVVKKGEALEVKLIEVDARTGRFRLSRKALLPEPTPEEREAMAKEAEQHRERRGGGGGRGGDRRGGDRRGGGDRERRRGPPRDESPRRRSADDD